MNTFYANVLVRFCCVLFLVSCITAKPNDNFKRILNNSESRTIPKLNFEGVYYNNVVMSSLLEANFFFFKNGLIYSDNITSVSHSTEAEKWFRRYLSGKEDWGTYEIIGDTINACIYYWYLADGHGIMKQTNFRGNIKNRDTILNWHMIEPYPKMDESFKKQYTFLKLPRNLYFKPLPFKPFMDSVSEKAWILKYRDKK